MVFFQKYMLTKNGLNFTDIYKNFNNIFLYNHKSGKIDEDRTVRFDFDAVALYIVPIYNEKQKPLNANMFIIANQKDRKFVDKALQEIKQKGFILEKIINKK